MNPQDQLKLEERRAGKILLDLIDKRAAEVVIKKAQIHAREIAREEIASMAGLVLRRLQDLSFAGRVNPSIAISELSAIFGELLRDYGATENEPGE